MMRIFVKKFRVRVRYFGSGYYTVDYALYRIIPIWHSLSVWFEQSLDSGTQCWTTKLMERITAEELAKEIGSIDDVWKYYKPEREKESDFYKRRDDYYAKNVPYKNREINRQ